NWGALHRRWTFFMEKYVYVRTKLSRYEDKICFVSNKQQLQGIPFLKAYNNRRASTRRKR
ncbi:hypothetical protein COL95_20445, partial [Bacillus anthracis]